ncbi:MAG: hypothetical protein H7270_06490 [Dermatophilaceae bacterium]|nr:hypothetical protein [Dermatophilaceae bacterium]
MDQLYCLFDSEGGCVDDDMVAFPRVVLALCDLFPGGFDEPTDIQGPLLGATAVLGGVGADDLHVDDVCARADPGVTPWAESRNSFTN